MYSARYVGKLKPGKSQRLFYRLIPITIIAFILLQTGVLPEEFQNLPIISGLITIISHPLTTGLVVLSGFSIFARFFCKKLNWQSLAEDFISHESLDETISFQGILNGIEFTFLFKINISRSGIELSSATLFKRFLPDLFIPFYELEITTLQKPFKEIGLTEISGSNEDYYHIRTLKSDSLNLLIKKGKLPDKLESKLKEQVQGG